MARAFVVVLMLLVGLSVVGQEVEVRRGRFYASCRHRGIRRVRTLDVYSSSVPASFEGVRLAFVTDTHYPSRFTDKTLASLERLLTEIRPDVLLLGGDYQEGCAYVAPLFASLMRCEPRLGAYAVLGNNDYERCTALIKEEMASRGITFVEDSLVAVAEGDGRIYIAGAHNSFKRRETSACVANGLEAGAFCLLLTHTPDYAEDVDIAGVDMALAGHTHGGQVTLFGLWAPKTASHYGQRFRHGLNYNSAGQVVLTSNGIGTSRARVRLFASSEVHLLRLHHKE